jgi:hypothetical protein
MVQEIDLSLVGINEDAPGDIDLSLIGIDSTAPGDIDLSIVGLQPTAPITQEDSEFSKGIKRGFNNVQAITGDAISVMGQLFGSDDIEQYGDAVSMKNRIEAANVGNAEVARIEDVNSAEDIGP